MLDLNAGVPRAELGHAEGRIARVGSAIGKRRASGRVGHRTVGRVRGAT
jgi:hypothetical protein